MQLNTPFQIWYQAARPRSLTATYVPIALGGVIALQDGAFNVLFFVLALLGTLALQIGANLSNEYFDYAKGVEAEKTHGLGLILKQGYLTPQQVLIGAVGSFVIGSLIGLFLVSQTGWLILWIGLAGVAVAILYTAGPFALAYIGLGEIAVFIFMGPLIVLGTYYVMTEKTSDQTIIGALPIAFLVAAILHANNLRDLDADKVSGKNTLAVRFGRRFAQGEYVVLTLGGLVMVVLLAILGQIPATSLLSLILLPETLRLCRIATTSEDPKELHMVLVHTARLHKWFGAAYVVGWLISLAL
ncbi:MAG: 1,4-dihydroxy-2-naphthoate octaprenyltransferase [Anaerolineae bacterium]|nr:MAG: 1,4-dihydroxy-2-naphthoate octaprenyltransferase [Anaerolineae bacterium]